MKRLLLTLAILAGVSAFAQNTDIDALRKMVENGRVSASYSFILNGKVNCSGVITVQQPCFKAEGNGMEIFCDGSTRWTVDRESKEVYIETAERPDEYLYYLSDITDLEIKNVRTEALSEDIGMFRFDVGKLDSQWVVTDLR